MNRLIETDNFPFEHISKIAERESWRKDVNRPIYHLHKWWAKRLGSVFRAIILGCAIPETGDLLKAFYSNSQYKDLVIVDPFMGGGTTIGEALKLGVTAYGKDINPVAAETVRVSLTPLDGQKLNQQFKKLSQQIGPTLLSYYSSVDSQGNTADVLYYFWVMQQPCAHCNTSVDLFSSYILSQDAYPLKKPTIQVVCPCCGFVFPDNYNNTQTTCPSCSHNFVFREGPAKGKMFRCSSCSKENKVASRVKPAYRLYAKLLLRGNQEKEYLKTTDADIQNYQRCQDQLEKLEKDGAIKLPVLTLEDGFNTQQAINYGFHAWRDFFNDRQLLLLGLLYKEISQIEDDGVRSVFRMIFSAALEFNNMFASYKGEGTGAVRHMFAHHILKPERTPIETNIWGTTKSSGSFSGIFKTKTKRIIDYRNNPKEVSISHPHNAQYKIANTDVKYWNGKSITKDGCINLACGDSSSLDLPDKSVDFVVTDPPFFDNVHYSELADFFYSWLSLEPQGFINADIFSTRNKNEVQDSDELKFSDKFENVLREANRVLKDDGLLVFSYHHSKNEGWTSIARAIANSGFIVENSHPVKAEMSVATPKQQAKEPIQLDILLVCKKTVGQNNSRNLADDEAIILRATEQTRRLEDVGFKLSKNDLKIILYGQLLKVEGENFNERHLNLLLKNYLDHVMSLPD